MSQAVVRVLQVLRTTVWKMIQYLLSDRIQYAVDIAAYAEYALFVALIMCLY